ncbi:hypothetical protein B0H19DRAFT_1366768 [Mycena capillaripes]|nr:hypothetical protein B0H19DRAFT_1366768 [Mycena capillaripes]
MLHPVFDPAFLTFYFLLLRLPLRFLPLGAGAVVEISTSSKEAAVLLLPDGATRTDLRRKKKIRDYALKHAQRWYAFVNGDLERMVVNGDLYLVTETDKSFSWSVAAVENRSEDCKISLKLKAAQVGSAGTSCFWEWETANSFADSGPRPLPTDGERTENQTVFLRGFKVAISTSPLKKAAMAISVVDSKPSDILSKIGGSPFSQSRTGSFFRSSGAPVRGGADVDQESIDASAEYFPADSKTYHPASVINKYLLNSSPTQADVAVTHDDEWVSVLNENDEEIPDDCELVRRIADKYNIDISSARSFPFGALPSEIAVVILKLAKTKSSTYSALMRTSRAIATLARLECVPEMVILSNLGVAISFYACISVHPEVGARVKQLWFLHGLAPKQAASVCPATLKACTNVERLACIPAALIEICSGTEFRHTPLVDVTLDPIIPWESLLGSRHGTTVFKQIQTQRLVGGTQPTIPPLGTAFRNLTDLTLSSTTTTSAHNYMLRFPDLMRVVITVPYMTWRATGMSFLISEPEMADARLCSSLFLEVEGD